VFFLALMWADVVFIRVDPTERLGQFIGTFSSASHNRLASARPDEAENGACAF